MRGKSGKFVSRRTLSIIAVVSLLLLSLVAFTAHLSVNSLASNETNSSSLILCKNDTTTTTKLSASTINLGNSVTDNVTVAGSHGTPTGTVTFQVKFNGGSWTTYDTENLSGGKATSKPYTPSSAGNYWFRVIYGGNSTYNGSQSCDTSEPLCVISKHNSNTSTQLSAGTINLGESVTDNVTVTGSFGTPTGSVTFQVKFNGGSWATYDNENLVNGKATSKPYTPSSAGSYWFKAIYSGNDNYNSSQSGEESEPLSVLPVKHNSTTLTQLSASTINLGDSVTDNVTVSGPFGTPTGTVTFQVKFNGGSWTTYDTENLVNGMATSIAYVPSQAGNYWFMAIYSGDENYYGSQSDNESEPLTVNIVPPHNSTTSTQLSISMITLGDNVTDTVTVTGLVSPLPTGTVDFQVKIDGGLWITYDIENLSGGMATSTAYVPLAAGDYWFRAIYSGDENYYGSQSPDDNEPLTVKENENEPLWVNKGPSTTTTMLSASTIIPGDNVIDTVTVTGLGGPFPVPTGTVTFQIKFDNGSWVTYDIETLSGGTATSIAYVPLQAGQYWFRAIYSGDNNYNGSQSNDESEPLLVTKLDTTTMTELSESIITLGENVTDTVTVTGLVSPLPTGTVAFQVKFDGGSWITYDTENLVNGTATSIEYVPLQAGQYYFRAIYSGDNNYNGSTSPDESEPLLVTKHDTHTTTQLSESTITLGENVTDTATVTGLAHPPYPLPTGTITFQVKFDGGSWITYDTENLVNGTATSIEYVPLQAGQYYFRAIYSGDNNYNGSQSS